MNATKEVQLLENSKVKLTIRIPTEDVRKQYDDILKEYTQKAHLKGFRPGKVPADIIIRKLGPALIDQTQSEVLEKSLSEVVRDAWSRSPFPTRPPRSRRRTRWSWGRTSPSR